MQLAVRMLSASPVAQALTRGKKCIFVNDALVAALGRSKEELLALEDLFGVVAPDQQEKLRARHAARVAGEPVPTTYEVTVIGGDGQRRELELEPRLLDAEHSLITVRPLGEAVRGRDLLLALGELQARAQRERTVRGVVDVSLKGLSSLGVSGGLVRLEHGLCKLASYTLSGPFAATLEPVMGFWRATAGVPSDSVPRLKSVIFDQRSLYIDDLVPLMRHFLLVQLGWPEERIAGMLHDVRQHQLVMTPLRVREQPYGAVMVTGEGLRSPDLAALSLFAQQLGAMIEVAENIEALELQNRTLEAIHTVARCTHSTVEALVQELLPLIAETTRSSQAAIFLAEPNGEWLSLAGTTNPSAFGGRFRRLPVQKTATGGAVRDSAPRAFSVDEWPSATREDIRKEGYLQLAVIPLIVEGRVAGVLNLTRTRDERYDDAQLRGADMLVSQVALQLERVRKNAEVERRVEDLSLVNEVGALIAQELRLERVVDVAMSHATRLVGMDHAFLFLLDEGGQRLTLAATSRPGPPPDLVFRIGEPSAAFEAVNTKKPVCIEDTQVDERISKPVTQQLGYLSLMSLPLLSEGKALGALVLGDLKGNRRFTPNEIDRAVAVANQLASALVNARLFESVKQGYQQLAAAQAELVKRERLAALGELSAVVAHEVRNPLAVIFNSLAGLRRSGEIDGESGTLLRIVNEEAERLNRMVSDLLDFARPHQAKKRQERLAPLLADALDSAARVFPGSRVKLSLDVSPELGEVPMDAPLLRQALMNLIVNALQAMPNGGEIRVRAGLTERNGRQVAKIEVADDGPGIPTADVERIFQPFFTTRATGTGLGLAVVKRIAEAHGADLALESGVGRGATFSICLPM